MGSLSELVLLLKPSKVYLVLLIFVFIVSLFSISILLFSVWAKMLFCLSALFIFLSSLRRDFLFLKPLPERFDCLPGSKLWRYAAYLRLRCHESNQKQRVLLFSDQFSEKAWKDLRRHLLFQRKAK